MSKAISGPEGALTIKVNYLLADDKSYNNHERKLILRKERVILI